MQGTRAACVSLINARDFIGREVFDFSVFARGLMRLIVYCRGISWNAVLNSLFVLVRGREDSVI